VTARISHAEAVRDLAAAPLHIRIAYWLRLPVYWCFYCKKAWVGKGRTMMHAALAHPERYVGVVVHPEPEVS
jgi:hypothetical protein